MEDLTKKKSVEKMRAGVDGFPFKRWNDVGMLCFGSRICGQRKKNPRTGTGSDPICVLTRSQITKVKTKGEEREFGRQRGEL